MKRILGLDIGTNSIGWALVELDFDIKKGCINGVGSRIIPMPWDELSDFDKGTSISQTAERTKYRGARRLNERFKKRRERLLRVLNVLNFLPEHYASCIDFEKYKGLFKDELEPKLTYKLDKQDKHQFIFKDSYNEMVSDFKSRGYDIKIPYDWTLYYLRKKALSKRITKYELAWLLLNFNQKRGYNQLRGQDDDEFDKSKNKSYEKFKVENVRVTDDINSKGGTLYEIYSDKGKRYEKRSKNPLNNWEGKIKEFIVTKQLLKDGTRKNLLKEVNSEEDWIAIKKKTEQVVKESDKKLGEFIYEKLLCDNSSEKINGGLIRTIDRSFYRDELKQILSVQQMFHPELQSVELFRNSIEELYPRNEAHKRNLLKKDIRYLLIEDILFYQRPLKSKKFTIAECPYESRSFVKYGERKKRFIKCIPKSHPLFQEFRLWQFIHNLRIFKKLDGADDENITKEIFSIEEDYEHLFEYLNDRKGINQTLFLKYLKKEKKIIEIDNYRWNYLDGKDYPCNETRFEFLKRFRELNKLNKNDSISSPTEFLTQKIEIALWHIVYSIKDPVEFEKALGSFAEKHSISKEFFKNVFKKIKPYPSDYGSYSHKAISKLLPLMKLGKYWEENNILGEVKSKIKEANHRLKDIGHSIDKLDAISDDYIGSDSLKCFIKLKKNFYLESFDIEGIPLKGLNTYQACYAVYGRHSEVAEISQWNKPEDIDNFLKEFKQHQLRNPIVEKTLLETLRVVRDIWKYYGNGEKGFFDEIHLELGRSMKNSSEKRKKIQKEYEENEKTNERIRLVLEELAEENNDVRPYSSSQFEKLKLYEEGVCLDSVEIPEDIQKIQKTYAPSKKEIERYRLWLEQGYVSPYTKKVISLSELFNEKYQIEHIIPKSRYFDDSISNKVLCESEVNLLKSNQTAFEFIKNCGGKLVELSFGKSVRLLSMDEYKRHCNKYFKKNKRKLNYLLSEEVPESFINRQLNDSRYISKVAKSLLGNIVREDTELEATPKKLIVVTGSITSRLKRSWGLNDIWNEIISPRFIRMNELTRSEKWGWHDKDINAFRMNLPKKFRKGFNPKRIDHRHHALDALVIACTTKDHINYISSMETEKSNYNLRNKLISADFKKSYYIRPWNDFPIHAKRAIESTIVSFKNNLRVINRVKNKSWSWVNHNGHYKKELISQKKTFVVRKPLHKETFYGKIDIKDKTKDKIVTASREHLSKLTSSKRLDKIADKSIKNILLNHLKNYGDEEKKYELAFNTDGIDELNKNIVKYNNGKFHHPIYKVRLYEKGQRFQVGKKGNKKYKYVEAAKGTNLFFAIYWNKKKQKRYFESIPFNEVIEHQIQNVNLQLKAKNEIPVSSQKGQFLFSLSPGDLVYVPSDNEIEGHSSLNIGENLSKEQVDRIYITVKCTGTSCYFRKQEVAKVIADKMEYESGNTMQKDINNNMIKQRCWKIKVNRLGFIESIDKGYLML